MYNGQDFNLPSLVSSFYAQYVLGYWPNYTLLSNIAFFLDISLNNFGTPVLGTLHCHGFCKFCFRYF